MILILIDQSRFVLIFICCPLTLLLIAGIIMAIRMDLPTDRAEAAADLRQIGIDVDRPPDQAKLLQTLVEIDRSARAGEPIATVPRLMSLISKATKPYEETVILAGRGAGACIGSIKGQLLTYQAERVRNCHRVEKQQP